jgi:hypothetical protein
MSKKEIMELLDEEKWTEECELAKEFIKELPEDSVLEMVRSRPNEPVLWVWYTTAYNWGLIYTFAGFFNYLIAWNPNRPRIMKWKTKFMYLD